MAAAAAILAAASCGGSTVPPGIAIGVVAPTSGPLAPRGQDLVDGVRLACERLEPAQRPSLIEADGAGDARAAAIAAERVLDAGARVVIGPPGGDGMAAVALLAAARGVPCILPACSGESRGAPPPAGRVVVGFGPELAAASLAGFAEEDLRLRRLALIVDLDSGEALALADAFSREFQRRRGRIVDTVYYRAGAAGVPNALDGAAALDVQGALVAGEAGDLAAMVGAARSPRLAELVLLGGDGWDGPGPPAVLAGRVAGAFRARHFDPASDRPQAAAFAAAFRERYGRAPGDAAALGFDAASLALAALQRSPDPAALRRAVADATAFPGVTGAITFDAQGLVTHPSVAIESLHEAGGPRIVATRGG